MKALITVVLIALSFQASAKSAAQLLQEKADQLSAEMDYQESLLNELAAGRLRIQKAAVEMKALAKRIENPDSEEEVEEVMELLKNVDASEIAE